MHYLSKVSPEWPLRIGIGVMYLYSGQDLITSPTAWHWALPYWLQQIVGQVISIDTYLRLQGGVEIIMALCLFAWFLKPAFVKYIALLSTLEMAAILILAFLPFSENNFLMTFRDIGLLGGSLALTTILIQKSHTI